MQVKGRREVIDGEKTQSIRVLYKQIGYVEEFSLEERLRITGNFASEFTTAKNRIFCLYKSPRLWYTMLKR